MPGPRQPLYFAGARSVHTFGAGPVADGMGLINIVGSYDEQFVLSFTACREMMPDPAHYADCLETSFGELVGLPTSYRGADWAQLHETMKVDKKTRGDQLRFVVLDGLARPGVLTAPDPDLLVAAFAKVTGEVG